MSLKSTENINGYSCGGTENNSLGVRPTNNKNFTAIPFKFTHVGSGYQMTWFALSDLDNSVIYFSKDDPNLFGEQKKKYKLGRIAKMRGGTHHLLLLTKKGRVFTMGQSKFGQLGLGVLKYAKTPTELLFFQENGLAVKKIDCGYDQSFFLCDNNELYYCGRIGFGQLNGNDPSDSFIPKLCSTNVKKMWAGCESYHFFFVKENNQVFAMGHNSSGQLGVGDKNPGKTPKLVPNLKGDEIVDMSMGYSFSCLIKRNKEENNIVYQTGINSQVFKIMPTLEKENIVQIQSGCYHTLARSMKNELWAWGIGSQGEIPHGNTTQSPVKILFNKLNTENDIKIHCGCYTNFVYIKSESSMAKEFAMAFDNEEMVDLEINTVKVNKFFVEYRLGLKENAFKKKLEAHNKEDLKTFFLYVYSGVGARLSIVKEICQELGIQPLTEKIEDDLLRLYKDEESKDFYVLVSMNGDDDQEDDEIGEEDFEEISVHKFILAVRSGLFREMFSNVKEETQRVKDYSNKTIESLEILIKFLYTNTIELTADDDPQLIVEELSDAIEYYQLEGSLLDINLNNIKQQFNLKF
ncbi:btk-binding protein-related [Anaeramoeba flamelloides]|uniref:Btk-binding protein-related n=1 Tax=Anaeramoeba flamelloides TaxID=1746091 RepID=A0ABQ8Y917_9EUKA|nr:btk-binding protein-related [Anaeramoeba flamelloides]